MPVNLSQKKKKKGRRERFFLFYFIFFRFFLEKAMGWFTVPVKSDSDGRGNNVVSRIQAAGKCVHSSGGNKLCSSQESKSDGAQGFTGDSVVKNPPAIAGDMGSIPGLGRSHMPRSN